jgi:hypothetical protein
MHERRPTVLTYPRPTGNDRRPLPAVDLPLPSLSREQAIVTLGIILVLLAILVPTVRIVQENARVAAELQRQQQADPLMLEE